MIIILEKPFFPNMRVVNMPDMGIERIFELLLPCTQLVAVYLGGNHIITRDLPFICHFTKLRKVDLSANKIHYLPEQQQISQLTELEFLLLHKNEIVGWAQIERLMGLKKLRQLSLYGNPCSKILGYRQFMLTNMTHLWCLDEILVQDFEHKNVVAEQFIRDSLRPERAKKLKRFRPFNP